MGKAKKWRKKYRAMLLKAGDFEGHYLTICRMIDQRDRWAKAWKRSAKIESELAAAKEEISTLKAQIAILAG